MGRKAGTRNITGWEEHCILRDLAAGDAPEQIAAKYEVAVGTVYDRRWAKKHIIAEMLAEWANEFSDLWAAKKHARIADLNADLDSLCTRQQEMLDDAAAQTEVMQRVDPEAAPVRVDGPEWRAIIREKSRLSAQIEKSLGQDVQGASAIAGHGAYAATRLSLAGLKGRKDGPTPLPADPQPYAVPKEDDSTASQVKRWERQQKDAVMREMDARHAAEEAEYKAANPNWEAEEAAERELFNGAFNMLWQQLGTDDAFRQRQAANFGPDYYPESDAMTDAQRVEMLERQILLHDETRGEIAESLAYEVIEHARKKQAAEPAPIAEPPPVPVPEAVRHEPASVPFRMMPSPVAPGSVPDVPVEPPPGFNPADGRWVLVDA